MISFICISPSNQPPTTLQTPHQNPSSKHPSPTPFPNTSNTSLLTPKPRTKKPKPTEHSHRPTELTRLPNPPPSALKSLISASSNALCATLAPLRSLKLLPMLGVPSLPMGGGAAGLRDLGAVAGWRGFSRVWVWVWWADMLLLFWWGCEMVLLVVVSKVWFSGRGKGRRNIRV
jgi:hypothetical protein